MNINANITATGDAAGMNITPGSAGTYRLAFGNKITLSGANPSLTVFGRSFTIINSVEALQNMNQNLTGYYALGSDINASVTSGWNGGAGFVPIGGERLTEFTGAFDGMGHTITGLTINRYSNGNDFNNGLFGNTGTGSLIFNIGLIDSNITGHLYVGGLVGFATGTSIFNSYSEGKVTGTGDLGGLVGMCVSCTISNSYSTGEVMSVNPGADYEIGGFVGRTNGGTISNSYSTSTVTGFHEVGGFVGWVYGSIISNSYSTGTVTGGAPVGGFAGVATSASIDNCYTTGAVTGRSPFGNVGGFIGSFGSAGGVISNSYWDIQTSGLTSSDGGTGLTTAEMVIQASFNGWDFNNTWSIAEGRNYPQLRGVGGPGSTAIITGGSATDPGTGGTGTGGSTNPGTGGGTIDPGTGGNTDTGGITGGDTNTGGTGTNPGTGSGTGNSNPGTGGGIIGSNTGGGTTGGNIIPAPGLTANMLDQLDNANEERARLERERIESERAEQERIAQEQERKKQEATTPTSSVDDLVDKLGQLSGQTSNGGKTTASTADIQAAYHACILAFIEQYSSITQGISDRNYAIADANSAITELKVASSLAGNIIGRLTRFMLGDVTAFASIPEELLTPGMFNTIFPELLATYYINESTQYINQFNEMVNKVNNGSLPDDKNTLLNMVECIQKASECSAAAYAISSDDIEKYASMGNSNFSNVKLFFDVEGKILTGFVGGVIPDSALTLKLILGGNSILDALGETKLPPAVHDAMAARGAQYDSIIVRVQQMP